MKNLTKNQNQKKQKQHNKQKQKLHHLQPKSKASAGNSFELEEAARQLSGYDSYYKQLSEEVETIECHVRELRQTPGLEHLTESEAQAQVDFMLRYSAWVFNQLLQEQQIVPTADVYELDALAVDSADVAKVQKRLARVTKKVTKSLTR